MKKKKDTIFKVLTFVFLGLFVLLCVFDLAVESDSDNPIVVKAKILMAEYQYKKDPSEENLYALCDNLYSTNEYERVRKYYPKLLESSEMYDYLGDYCRDATEQSECYDLLLIKYLVAESMVEDFDADMFVDDMRKHKTEDEKFYQRMYLLVLLEFNEDDEDLAAFNSKLDLLLDHLTTEEKIAILVLQSNIYKDLGETSLSDQKMDEARFVQAQTN